MRDDERSRAFSLSAEKNPRTKFAVAANMIELQEQPHRTEVLPYPQSHFAAFEVQGAVVAVGVADTFVEEVDIVVKGVDIDVEETGTVVLRKIGFGAERLVELDMAAM